MRRILLVVLIVTMISSLMGCSSTYVGTYIGSISNATLSLNKDSTFTYEESGLYGQIHYDGTYTVDDDQIIIELKENLILYAKIEKDESLYIISDSSKWRAESFIKV